MIEDMSGAGSSAELRAVAARRSRARNRRIEAERASTAWPVFAPQTRLAEGPLGEAQAADREIARMYALRARRLAEFCAERPASVDRAQGEPGAMSAERWAARPEILRPVSEWAAPEVSIGLACSQGKASTLLAEARTLVCRLPGTLAALEGGLLTVDHRFCLLEHVAPIADDRLRAEVEAEVLRWVAERAGKKTITTPAQLGEKVLRVVTRRNARDRAQEAIKALRERGVFRQRERGEGLAGLGVVGTVPEIEALHAALAACVDALPRDAEDRRTREQKLLDVLLDLVLRPGESGIPPVRVLLTLVAPLQTALGGDAPAELNGRVVAAETARQLLNALTGAGVGEGALAELQDLAATDTEATDTEAPDIEAPDTDWERRLEEGEFDDPDPMPDEVWAASVAARLAPGEIDLERERDLAEAQDRWWREFEAGLHSDPDPDDPRGSPEDRPPGERGGDPLPSGGWWAAADRAVADATAAQGDAEAAL